MKHGNEYLSTYVQDHRLCLWMFHHRLRLPSLVLRRGFDEALRVTSDFNGFPPVAGNAKKFLSIFIKYLMCLTSARSRRSVSEAGLRRMFTDGVKPKKILADNPAVSFTEQNKAAFNGFTFIETVVSLLILFLLIGILLGAVMNVKTIFEVSDITALLQSDARLTMNAIANELRRSACSQISIIQNDPVIDSDSIVYHVPLDADGNGQPDLDISGQVVWDTTNVVLQRDPSQLAQLRKEIAGGENLIIGRNVRKINFIDQAIDPSLYQDELQVALELEKSDSKGIIYSLNLTSEINMRN